MSKREIVKVIPAVDSQDGAGVKLKRSIGRHQNARVDPFLMLDAFSSDNPDDYIAGFPPHPHRGFETVTYMLDGHMLHKDHLGNEGDLKAGGVQWMTAGSGVIHEERPQQVEGLLRGFQLWLNLPAADKMKPAAYQNIEPEQVPVIETDTATVKLIAGTLMIDGQEYSGPISAESTDPLYLDLQLEAGAEITLPLNATHNSLIYLFEGEARVMDQSLRRDEVSVLGAGESVTVSAGSVPARMLLLAGKPLNEPVVQYGPFVMNTMAEVDQAIQDYRSGRLTEFA
jgi:redox-sensitive bicupin YhaK (pirin superfamily)